MGRKAKYPYSPTRSGRAKLAKAEKAFKKQMKRINKKPKGW